jgi:hypothetical protein
VYDRAVAEFRANEPPRPFRREIYEAAVLAGGF